MGRYSSTSQGNEEIWHDLVNFTCVGNYGNENSPSPAHSSRDVWGGYLLCTLDAALIFHGPGAEVSAGV